MAKSILTTPMMFLITNATNGTYRTVTDECNTQQEYTPLKTLYIVSMAFILSLSIIGNSVVIFAVVLSPILKSKQTFHFAASLACSDMIMAIFQITFRIPVVIHNRTFCFPLAACFVRLMMDFFGNIASILNLLLISVDRFIAINLPYRYVELMSHHRCKIMLIAMWSFSACWSISAMFPWTSSQSVLAIGISGMCFTSNILFVQISYFGIYVPVFLIITCCYARILRVAFTQIKKMEATGTIRSSRKGSALSRRGSTLSKELKATKSIAMVYLAFCMCWLPSCVLMFIMQFDQPYLRRMMLYDQHRYLVIWYLFLDIFPAVITAINPIIYSFSNTQFRKAVRYVWRKFRANVRIGDDGFNQNPRASCVSTSMMTVIQESPVATTRHGKMNLFAIMNGVKS